MTDPRLDLVLERTVDVPVARVWRAWTRPEHLKRWFTPLPWTTVACEIDLRPGGIFRTVMRSPAGEDHTNLGCILEAVENRRFVWTDALEPGFRPARQNAQRPFQFTAVILLEPAGAGTKYSATAMHKDEDGRARHDAMGFANGWGTALDQLVAHMRSVED